MFQNAFLTYVYLAQPGQWRMPVDVKIQKKNITFIFYSPSCYQGRKTSICANKKMDLVSWMVSCSPLKILIQIVMKKIALQENSIIRVGSQAPLFETQGTLLVSSCMESS